jgi:hypothetical protein
MENRTYGRHHLPSHQLFTQRFDVRKTWPVIERGQSISSDNIVEFCLRSSLHPWEKNEGEKEGDHRGHGLNRGSR